MIERLAPELFKRCELKPCMHYTYFNCLCNLKSTRKTWTKAPPKDSAAAERELLAKARANSYEQSHGSPSLHQSHPLFTPSDSLRTNTLTAPRSNQEPLPRTNPSH